MVKHTFYLYMDDDHLHVGEVFEYGDRREEYVGIRLEYHSPEHHAGLENIRQKMIALRLDLLNVMNERREVLN